jgi:photosystem II stability/assembly factor-like uncharacterized protein
MKTCIVTVFVLMVLVACKKDNDPAPRVDETPRDTLMNWVAVNPSVSGDFADVWFTTRQAGVLLAPDGIYRTVDEGKTWTKRAPGGYYNLFFIDQRYGIAEGHLDFAYTLDSGATWIARPVVNPPNTIDGFYTSLSTGFVFNNGLFKTTDTARTWTKVLNQSCNAIYFSSPQNGWIHSQGKFYTTADGGNTWLFKSNLQIPDESVGILQFTDALHGKYGDNTVFAFSDDGGVTWTTRNFSFITDMQFVSNDVGYLSTRSEIFKTVDGGRNWARSCKVNRTILDFGFTDPNNGWACGFEGLLIHLKQ